MKPLPRKPAPVKGTVTPLPRPKVPGALPVPRIKKKSPVLYLLALLFLYFLILFSVQFFRYIHLTQEVRALNREIEAIREENSQLSQEIERLQDPEYMEELARRDLGMVHRNDYIFHIQRGQPNP